ncbi:hypothetical protein H2136_06430 [Aeromonas hydrophila]|uniref:Uncharacterized protein n=1 Tax=Aeromonas hydrophila TaxID=644 RepID=A0A926FPJ8_AERHY|nr:hypothetical protein [Aeromonas hydrophila]
MITACHPFPDCTSVPTRRPCASPGRTASRYFSSPPHVLSRRHPHDARPAQCSLIPSDPPSPPLSSSRHTRLTFYI